MQHAAKGRRGERAPALEPRLVQEALGRAVAAELPRLLPRQRWFGSKGRAIAAVVAADWARLGERAWLGLVDVTFDHGAAERYGVAFVLREDATPRGDLSLALDVDGVPVRAEDAFDDAGFALALLDAFARGASVPSGRGRLRFITIAGVAPLAQAAVLVPRRLGVEQSNTSVVYGDRFILKALRRVEPGISLDYELGAFLTSRAGFAHVPPVAGAIEYVPAAGAVATLAILQRYVPNHGDGWTYVVDHLRRLGPASADAAEIVADLRRLGAVTGGLHAALASDAADPAFAPEPITAADAAAWSARIAGDVRSTCETVRARLDRVPPEVRDGARALVAREAQLLERVRDLGALVGEGCAKIRIHGDYHLGQTLRTDDGFVILDFEGEPTRPLPERRRKQCALVDVAGMLRSLDYAVDAALAPAGLLEPAGARWVRRLADAFLAGYLEGAAPAHLRLVPAPGGGLDRALAVLELDRALYEIRYEIDHRPTWLAIPLRGLVRLLGRERIAW